MARAAINRGTTAGDGTGETAFSAFGKVNDNFTELYTGFVGKNNVATTDPVVTSDTAAGYSLGSSWFNSATGVLFEARDVTNGAAIWVRQSVQDHIGMVSGRYYQPLNDGIGPSSSTVNQNQLIAIPFRVPHKLSIDRLGMRLNGAVSGNVAMGVYSNKDAYPDLLLGQTATNPSTTPAADITSDITVPAVCQPGMVWLVCHFSAAAIVLGGYEKMAAAQVGGTNTINMLGSGAAFCYIGATLTYTGTLPSTFTSGGGPVAGWMPGIFARIA